MDRVETTILRNLIYDEEYIRKVIPFIQPDYFENSQEKIIFEEIAKFIVKYDKPASQEVLIRLYYDERGLDRYYGLLELGELGGLWKNVAGRYEMNGKKIYAKQILADPETYFTDEVMQALDEIAQKQFSYG